MNGRYPGGVNLEGLFVKPLRAQLGTHATDKLACGLVGERDGKQSIDIADERPRLLRKTICDALGEREGLARAGASLDE